MVERVATCRCGQLRARCHGDPIRVSICHCLDCQKRSGSAFSFQARWPDDQVEIAGESRSWDCHGDEGRVTTFRFCTNCGGTIAFVNSSMPGTIALPVGAFADPQFPSPRFSVYESRKHAFVGVLGDDVEHM
jgi:hypothetical protein